MIALIDCPAAERPGAANVPPFPPRLIFSSRALPVANGKSQMLVICPALRRDYIRGSKTLGSTHLVARESLLVKMISLV